MVGLGKCKNPRANRVVPAMMKGLYESARAEDRRIHKIAMKYKRAGHAQQRRQAAANELAPHSSLILSGASIRIRRNEAHYAASHALIPWQGDGTKATQIDRYDARGHLDAMAVSSISRDLGPAAPAASAATPLAALAGTFEDDEKAMANFMNFERYRGILGTIRCRHHAMPHHVMHCALAAGYREITPRVPPFSLCSRSNAADTRGLWCGAVCRRRSQHHL